MRGPTEKCLLKGMGFAGKQEQEHTNGAEVL